MCVKVKFDTEIGLQMARSGEGVSCLVYAVSCFEAHSEGGRDEGAAVPKGV